MQTFALGQKCLRQCRGSPMGSPLSPALCLMVASWLPPSVNKSGPSTSNISSPITTYSFARSAMWTTVSSLGTHASRIFHHMKYCLMMGSTENQSSSKRLHVGDKTIGTDLSRSYKCLPSPISLLSIPTQSASEWLPISVPHCCQRSIPGVSCSTRS